MIPPRKPAPVRTITRPLAWASALGVLLAVAGWLLWPGTIEPLPPSSAPPSSSSRPVAPDVLRRLAALEAREQEVADTVWAAERTADTCTAVIDAFWDSLNSATNRLALASTFPAGEWIVPHWNHSIRLPHDIVERSPVGPARSLDPESWHAAISSLDREGWHLVQTEFRHTQFEPDPAGAAGSSRFQFSAHLTHRSRPDRAVVEGTLGIDWAPPDSPASRPTVRRIDTRGLRIRTRSGPTPFVTVLDERIPPPPRGQSIDPLLVHDFDGDGLPEIALAARNQVFRRTAGGSYASAPLCRVAPDTVYTAVLGDFDGDGHVDLLSLGFVGMQLFAGSPAGAFDTPPRLVWPTGTANPLEFPMVLTCGDIDRDGDLDVFLGQYRDPYEGGAVPTPYFAANNGHPSFLLLNDGRGNLREATAGSGLESLRRRRVYSASFIDLDLDGHPDLVTTSDFAGVDVYRNDGRGRFEPVTGAWIGNPHGFGMGHALADFNVDGRLDLLMIGMTSPTVDRLEHLGLFRPGIPGDRTKRSAMTHGNRLYLGRPGSGFDESAFGDALARSGWSWGCGVGDFDNDGFPDVHVVNGLESRQTVREYEGEYWRHDLFVGGVDDDPAALLYFKSKNARTRGRGQSYGGYEKNRLYLNQAGATFLEVGHLFGVALENDSRNAVAADLDADGRVDLISTSFETWPEARQVLRVDRNELRGTGHWIGFRFPDQPGFPSPIGARIELAHGATTTTRALVTGDSHRSQHPATLHFGLGSSDTVDRATVIWPGGKRMDLKTTTADQYHLVRRSK